MSVMVTFKFLGLESLDGNYVYRADKNNSCYMILQTGKTYKIDLENLWCIPSKSLDIISIESDLNSGDINLNDIDIFKNKLNDLDEIFDIDTEFLDDIDTIHFDSQIDQNSGIESPIIVLSHNGTYAIWVMMESNEFGQYSVLQNEEVINYGIFGLDGKCPLTSGISIIEGKSGDVIKVCSSIDSNSDNTAESISNTIFIRKINV